MEIRSPKFPSPVRAIPRGSRAVPRKRYRSVSVPLSRFYCARGAISAVYILTPPFGDGFNDLRVEIRERYTRIRVTKKREKKIEIPTHKNQLSLRVETKIRSNSFDPTAEILFGNRADHRKCSQAVRTVFGNYYKRFRVKTWNLRNSG